MTRLPSQIFRARSAAVAFGAFVAVARWVVACLPSEPTTPLGYVIAPSSVPRDAGPSDAQPLEAGPAGRAIAEPPP